MTHMYSYASIKCSDYPVIIKQQLSYIESDNRNKTIIMYLVLYYPHHKHTMFCGYSDIYIFFIYMHECNK